MGIGGGGVSLHWEEIDEDLSVASLLTGQIDNQHKTKAAVHPAAFYSTSHAIIFSMPSEDPTQPQEPQPPKLPVLPKVNLNTDTPLPKRVPEKDLMRRKQHDGQQSVSSRQ